MTDLEAIYQTIKTTTNNDDLFLAMLAYADALEETGDGLLQAECWRLLGKYKRRPYEVGNYITAWYRHGIVWDHHNAKTGELPSYLFRRLAGSRFQVGIDKHTRHITYRNRMDALDGVLIAYYLLPEKTRNTVKRQMEKYA
jgi:hypothetical protein